MSNRVTFQSCTKSLFVPVLPLLQKSVEACLRLKYFYMQRSRRGRCDGVNCVHPAFGLGLLFGGLIYAAFAADRLKIHSQDNHFVYLADAFLSGQTELKRRPHHGNDWASFIQLELKGASAEKYGSPVNGFFTRRKGKPNQFRTLDKALIEIPKSDRGTQTTRHYVSFPPGPAVLMMPWVAAVGYGTNDVVFTVIVAGLNLVFMLLLLVKIRDLGYIDRPDSDLFWFVGLFGFSTAVLWCSVLGQVWFTALVVGLAFHTLYLLFAFDCRRPFIAGLFLSFAFATRASLVFAAVFFIGSCS